MGAQVGINLIPSTRSHRPSQDQIGGGCGGEGVGVNLGKGRVVGRRLVQRSAAYGAGEALSTPREPPQPYWVALAGRRLPSKGEKFGEEGMEQETERREWEEREGLIQRKKKRKGRAKLKNDGTPTACQGSGSRLCPPPGFQERGSPEPAWSLAHPFSELLYLWWEVRSRYVRIY